MNPQALVKSVEPIIRKAGDLLRSYFRKTVDRTYKDDGSFATQADIESEQLLIEHLKDLVPGAGFFAEESGKIAGNEYCWVIDPLDGTTNFARGLPYFCTSVALTKNDKPIAGFIFQPLMNEFFYAIKGGGAYLNGQPISVSEPQPVEKSLLIYALPYQDESNFFKAVCHFAQRANTSRMLGAAALDQAYCAAGKADAVLFTDLSWWDVAAGMLLIEEAGGAVSQFDGTPVTPSYRSLLAGNKPICNEISSLVTDL